MIFEDILTVSVGQFAGSENKSRNLENISSLVEEASNLGSDLILFPEFAMYRPIELPSSSAVLHAEDFDGSFVTALQNLSAQHSIRIAAGMHTKTDNPNNCKNTLVLVDGMTVEFSYDKIHLFDAFSASESSYIQPGHNIPKIIEIRSFKIGFVICYDLRFPELFRALAAQGVEIICVSASWLPGALKEDHWLTLLKARAIENSVYILAAGDVSSKGIGRSVVVNPLGVVESDAGVNAKKLLTHQIEKSYIQQVRNILPSLSHRRTDIFR